MSVPLETAVTAVFDANGDARVSTGPGRANVSWRVTRMVVNVIPIPDEVQPQLRVYRNFESPSSQVDSTSSGADATSETDIPIRSGENLLFIWNGGQPDSIATAVISGEIN